MNDKQLAQSGLNTLAMVAFAVPGCAPVGLLALIGNFFVGMLFPDTKAPPQPEPITAKDLQAALDSLKADIVDAAWLAEVDDITNNLPGLNQGLQDVWTGMLARNLDKNKLVMLDANNNDDTTFITDTDKYFDLEPAEDVGGMLTLLRKYRNTLTMSSLNDPSLTPAMVLEKRTQHTGVYILVCSITVTYLKSAVAWNWGSKMLKIAQAAKYQKDLKDYQDGVKKNSSYAMTHKQPVAADYPGVNTDPEYHPTWNDWLVDEKAFCAATMLIREVQAILDDCVTIPGDGTTPDQDGFYTTFVKNWDDYEQQMSGCDVSVNAGQDPSAILMKTAVEQAMKRNFVRKQLLEKYAFEGITEDDVVNFERAVKAWKSASASVNFTVYSVVDGDTLSSIALAKYKDASLADQIAGANRDVLPDTTTISTLLKKDLILKIYARDALSYVQQPVSATNA